MRVKLEDGNGNVVHEEDVPREKGNLPTVIWWWLRSFTFESYEADNEREHAVYIEVEGLMLEGRKLTEWRDPA